MALSVNLHIDDNDGSVRLQDLDGQDLTPRLQRLIRSQNENLIRERLEAYCAERNRDLDEIIGIHLRTPSVSTYFSYQATAFDEPSPTLPRAQSIGFFARLFPARRRKIEDANAEAQQVYARSLVNWNARREAHDAAEAQRKADFARADAGDTDAMSTRLQDVFLRLRWPRETLVAFDLSDDGRSLSLDVDLPEIEDLPGQRYQVANRGLRIQIRTASDTQARKDYMHVHGVAFRLVGEAFAALRFVDEVTVSAYSQRIERATAHVVDEYLISARIPRVQWERIEFSRVASLDLPASFEAFELRRRMTATGIFKPIDPFGTSERG